MQEDDLDSVHSSLLSEGSAVARLERELHTTSSTPVPMAEAAEEGRREGGLLSTKRFVKMWNFAVL